MAQRRFHYEQAFEHYLRANRVPYVAVDEARKALLPLAEKSEAGRRSTGMAPQSREDTLPGAGAIKSFDFVVYAPGGRNLLVDVKGRMFGRPPTPAPGRRAKSMVSNRRFESWVTDEDVEGLARWQDLFGEAFQAAFVFSYCLRQQPPDALFEEVFTFGGRWYALREVSLAAYRREMVRRSASWGTLHVPREAFDRISRPFSVRPAPRNGTPGERDSECPLWARLRAGGTASLAG